MNDITTADLWTELPTGHPLVRWLRHVWTYRGPGYDPSAGPDLEDAGAQEHALDELHTLGLVSRAVEPLGWYLDDVEQFGMSYRITAHGLEDLVLHGYERIR